LMKRMDEVYELYDATNFDEYNQDSVRLANAFEEHVLPFLERIANAVEGNITTTKEDEG